MGGKGFCSAASCIVCSCIATHAYAGSAHGSNKKYI